MKYKITTLPEKKVAEYVGISVLEVENLCYYDYLMFLRDAVIFNLSQTEAGRKYLYECWIFEQTKPDRKALRKNFNNSEKSEKSEKEVSESGGER